MFEHKNTEQTALPPRATRILDTMPMERFSCLLHYLSRTVEIRVKFLSPFMPARNSNLKCSEKRETEKRKN